MSDLTKALGELRWFARHVKPIIALDELLEQAGGWDKFAAEMQLRIASLQAEEARLKSSIVALRGEADTVRADAEAYAIATRDAADNVRKQASDDALALETEAKRRADQLVTDAREAAAGETRRVNDTLAGARAEMAQLREARETVIAERDAAQATLTRLGNEIEALKARF